VFFTRSPESFAEARAKRIEVSGNPAQYDNLQLFIDEQDLISRLVAESTLPTLELDISHSDVSMATDQIADWMETTGALWAD